MHAQDCLNLHILCLFDGFFSLDTAHIKQRNSIISLKNNELDKSAHPYTELR